MFSTSWQPPDKDARLKFEYLKNRFNGKHLLMFIFGRYGKRIHLS
jgi:hypothetical protein